MNLRPSPGVAAALLVSAGWLAAWAAVSLLTDRWPWLLLGAGLLAIGAGVAVFWWEYLRAQIDAAKPERPRIAA